jgi:hypothetical protein
VALLHTTNEHNLSKSLTFTATDLGLGWTPWISKTKMPQIVAWYTTPSSPSTSLPTTDQSGKQAFHTYGTINCPERHYGQDIEMGQRHIEENCEKKHVDDRQKQRQVDIVNNVQHRLRSIAGKTHDPCTHLFSEPGDNGGCAGYIVAENKFPAVGWMHEWNHVAYNASVVGGSWIMIFALLNDAQDIIHVISVSPRTACLYFAEYVPSNPGLPLH